MPNIVWDEINLVFRWLTENVVGIGPSSEKRRYISKTS